MNQRNGKNDQTKYYLIGLTTFVIIALSILFFFIIFRITDILSFFGTIISIISPIISGIVFAYILNPISSAFERQFKLLFMERVKNKKRIQTLSRGISVALSFLVALLIIYILINLIAPQIYQSIQNLVNTLPEHINKVISEVNELISNNSIFSSAISALDSVKNWLQNDLLKQTDLIAEYLSKGLKSIYSVLMNVIIGTVVSVYLLISKEKFLAQCKKFIYFLLPKKAANILLSTSQKAHEIFSGFIVGKVLDSCIIGILCFFGLSVLQVPFSLLVSLIIGVTNIIPFFGPIIGAIPSALIILIESPIHGLYFIIFIIILQQIDGNIIGPRILGNSLGISSFWVIFSILLFSGLFGFVGMLIGVPLFAVIYYIISTIINNRLRQKGLSINTEDYIQKDIPESSENNNDSYV